MKTTLAVLLLMLLALPALAQDDPVLKWNDPQRFSFGAGASYAALHVAGADPQPAFLHEWRLGGRVAWSAVKRVGLEVNAARGFDNKDIRIAPEARLRLTSKTDPMSMQIGLGYEFINTNASQVSPTWKKQFKVGAYVGRAFPFTADRRGAAVVGLYSTYGVDDKDVEAGVSGRLVYTLYRKGYGR